ncbi:hypothetical protein FA15DRAFT_676612 [Coprinopsis marcescibilis]|uniref:Mucoidy inhibitor A n=1 Tax=Coprinopsis marcescibilis TaxID=230819 RepID=A0A5C3K9B9_COPMA|nr:hypothetical protein FA15DRAFT_676612 [Coprinopsis marcescibilis]
MAASASMILQSPIMANVIVFKAAEHPIKSVTIFKSSKAEVVRTFRIDLAQGQNKIEIKGLSSFIDPLSVRVSGLGEARLYDVVCRVETSLGPHGVAAHEFDDASEVIRLLHVKRDELAQRKEIRLQEKTLLLQYAESLKGEHVPPTQMIEFMKTYITQSQKNVEEVAKLDAEILGVDRDIGKEEEKVMTKKGQVNGRVDVVIVADGEVKVDLVLTYIVSNAQWQPTYELHAKTENGKPSPLVKLHYRARITQSTGEDWTDTSLTLSTVSGTDAHTIPSLKTVKLSPKSYDVTNAKKKAEFVANVKGTRFQQIAELPKHAQQQQRHYAQQQQYQPQQQFQANCSSIQQDQPVQHMMMQMAQIAPQYDAYSEDEFEEVATVGPAPVTIAEPTTIVNETPVAVTFSVHGESTIPSDGIDHQVSVAILPFESVISYITIPKIDPRVYLQCRVKNSSDYRLLPGSVRVIFDDSFVSTTRISDINTGDDFECTLGDDAATKVTYSRTLKTEKSSGGAFTETTNTTTYITKITVHNKHAFDIDDLVVRHIIPMCEDRRGQVILRKPDGLAAAKVGQTVSLQGGLKVAWTKSDGNDSKGGDKEGRYEWTWKVSSGGKVNLEAEWDVKVPGESAWHEVQV